MAKGFVYLVAVGFCIEALEEAIVKYDTPDIVNTDQGSQFTSLAFTEVLLSHDIRISIDGKSCWQDNVFLVRLWKSIKYEEFYLHAFDSVSQARSGIVRDIDFLNNRRRIPAWVLGHRMWCASTRCHGIRPR